MYNLKFNNINIVEVRKLLDAEAISREDYWLYLRSRLEVLDDFKGSLFDSIKNITIDKNNVVISYNFFEKFFVNLDVKFDDTRSASNTIIANGEYELTQMSILCQMAKVSSYFLDIGSNVGLYSICASLVNRKLRVGSFEPNIRVGQQQKTNLKLNQIENVTLYPFGLSNENSDSKNFYIPQLTGSGGGSLIDLHTDEGPSKQVQVVLRRLDELDVDITKGVDLVKIDIEGAELEFLKGGAKTISDSKPVIICELLRKWMKPFNSHPQDFLSFLLNLDYSCYEFMGSGIQKITEINEDTVGNNFIFVHKSDIVKSNILAPYIY